MNRDAKHWSIRVCVVTAALVLAASVSWAGTITPAAGQVYQATFVNTGSAAAYELSLGFSNQAGLGDCNVTVDGGGPIAACNTVGNSLLIAWKAIGSGLGQGESVSFTFEGNSPIHFAGGAWYVFNGQHNSFTPGTVAKPDGIDLLAVPEPSADLLFGTTLLLGVSVLAATRRLAH